MKFDNERYNTVGIGYGYDSTRKADQYLAKRIYEFIDTGKNDSIYLDLGCGTGNYCIALNKMGLNFIGIDPSDEMLNKAREKTTNIVWKKGSAENIELDNESIDGVLICLTMHHWKDLDSAFTEINSILKHNGKVVVFTTLPEQTNSYWLRHYFPKMISDSIKILPTLNEIKNAFQIADLKITTQEAYFVKPNLEDHFLYCGKNNPELYLNEEIRKGISSFSMLAHETEISDGIKQLRNDINSRAIRQIIKDHENDQGDYLFIVGEKA